jgi:hypothetical protein
MFSETLDFCSELTRLIALNFVTYSRRENYKSYLYFIPCYIIIISVLTEIVATVGVLNPGTLEGLFLLPAPRPVLIVQIHCSDITSHSNTNLDNLMCNLKVMIFCEECKMRVLEATLTTLYLHSIRKLVAKNSIQGQDGNLVVWTRTRVCKITYDKTLTLLVN